MSNVANRIREAREAAGLTQGQLAEIIGGERVSVSKWETGKSNPSGYVLDSIGYRTGFNPDWMRSGQAPKYLIGTEELAIPYCKDRLDAELLADILGTLQEFLLAHRLKLPPKVFGTLAATLYESAMNDSSLRADLPSRIQPFIRLALAGSG